MRPTDSPRTTGTALDNAALDRIAVGTGQRFEADMGERIGVYSSRVEIDGVAAGQFMGVDALIAQTLE